jgi:hemoglobin
MSHAISEPENLFDRLGGQVGIDAAVDLYYRKVLADERLAHFFVGVDMGRQRLKQTEFLTSAFGGPRRFDSADLAAANEPLIEKGLDDGQFDALVGYLQDALGDLGVAAGLSAEAVAIVESTRPEVVGRKGRRKG